MRVAIDTSHADRGASGIGTYIDGLIPALEAEGVEVVRLRQPVRGRRGGGNNLRSAANAALEYAWTRELLPRAAERATVDVLHHPLPAWSPTKIPQAVTIHDVAYGGRGLRTQRGAVAHAAAVVAVSETTKRDVLAWLRAPAERIVVAPNGPGRELRVDARGPAEHFLCVGDDEREKFDALLDAYERYRRLGGTKELVLAAAPDASDLARLHAQAVALVHPSAGTAVLEAMSAGTPVIAARNAAVEELAGEAALIVDDWALAEAMQRVERDDRLQEMMAEAGRRRAAQFSWQRSARAHMEAYTLARDS